MEAGVAVRVTISFSSANSGFEAIVPLETDDKAIVYHHFAVRTVSELITALSSSSLTSLSGPHTE